MWRRNNSLDSSNGSVAGRTCSLDVPNGSLEAPHGSLEPPNRSLEVSNGSSDASNGSLALSNGPIEEGEDEAAVVLAEWKLDVPAQPLA